MALTKAQQVKAYRAKKRAEMGEDAYKAEEARKRKERRLTKKLESSLINNTNLTIPPKPTIKAPAPPYPKTFLRSVLIDKIYTAKLQFSKAKKKTLKKSSVENQYKKVENIHMAMFGREMKENLNWLSKTDDVLNFIKLNKKWKTPNSKNSQLQAIASILKPFVNYKNEYIIYSTASTDGRLEIKKTDDDNLLSDSERAEILPWSEIKNLYKKPVMSAEDRALIGIYTLLPPRRVEDVSLIIVLEADDAHEVDNDNNFLILDDAENPSHFIYNRYKTDKTYGSQRIDIPPELKKILKTYLDSEYLPSGYYLFSNDDNEQYKNFSEVVTRVFQKYTNKKLTANLLRHSFISDYLSKPRSINQKKDIALKMGHSVNQQGEYVRLDV